MYAAIVIITLSLSLITAQETDLERRFACWGSVGPPIVSAQCHRNTVIHVVRAGLKVQNNGASKCEYHEGDCGCTSDQPGCQMPDVKVLCMGKPSCRLDVTQQYIDTGMCQGFSDYMFIEYTCIQATKEKSQDICMTMTQEQTSGFLQTPNYPQTYPNNRHCECTLVVTSKTTIDLKILDLRLADESCKHDEVTLEYNGQMTKLCGQSNGLQEVIPTKAHQVKVLFDSDQEGGDNGFWIKYEANGPVKVSCKSSYKHNRQAISIPKVQTHTDTLEEQDANFQQVLFPDNKPNSSLLDITDSNENTAEENEISQEEIYNESSEVTEQPNNEDFTNYIEMSTLGTLLAKTVSFNENYANMYQNVETVNAEDLANEVVEDTTQIPVEEDTPLIIQENEFNDNISQNDNVKIDLDEKSLEETSINSGERIRNMKKQFNEALQEEETEEKSQVTIINVQNRLDNSRQQKNAIINRESVSDNDILVNRDVPTEIPRRNSMRYDQRLIRQRLLNRGNLKRLNNYRENLRQSPNNNNGRARPYDRMSFERDMFEDYTDQASIPPQRERTRLRILEEVTKNNNTTNVKLPNERIRNRPQNIKDIVPTRHRDTYYEHRNQQRRPYNSISRAVQSNVRRKQPTRMIERENIRYRPTTLHKNNPIENQLKSDDSIPWWWKFTANKDHKILPTNYPKNNGLNEKMKNNFKDMHKKYHKSKNFIGKQPVNTNENNFNQPLNDAVQVPNDNADNLMNNVQDEGIQTGLLEGNKITEEDETNNIAEEPSDTESVTIIAVAVIAMIILIVVVGIVIRWVLNKREQKRVMRQRHKKECAMRQQHLRQSSSHPRNLR